MDPVTGTLTFTLANPLPPVLVAHASVVLKETEPDGDVDTSAPQTFTITATTTAPPAVANVIVHWGKEQASLLSMLNPVSGGNPYGGRIDIPFANINAIDIVFSQTINPAVAANALQVLGKYYSYTLSTPTFINSYTLEYKLTGNVLGGALGSDDITLKFNGNAVKVQGNGLNAASFTQTFNVLVGDVNNDGVVDLIRSARRRPFAEHRRHRHPVPRCRGRYPDRYERLQPGAEIHRQQDAVRRRLAFPVAIVSDHRTWGLSHNA